MHCSSSRVGGAKRHRGLLVVRSLGNCAPLDRGILHGHSTPLLVKSYTDITLPFWKGGGLLVYRFHGRKGGWTPGLQTSRAGGVDSSGGGTWTSGRRKRSTSPERRRRGEGEKGRGDEGLLGRSQHGGFFFNFVVSAVEAEGTKRASRVGVPKRIGVEAHSGLSGVVSFAWRGGDEERTERCLCIKMQETSSKVFVKTLQS